MITYGGPLSDVFDGRAADALTGLLRITRPGQPVLASVMSLLGTWRHFLPSVVAGADVFGEDVNDRVLVSGDLRVTGGAHACQLYRADQVADLVDAAGAELLMISASNWASLDHPTPWPPWRPTPTGGPGSSPMRPPPAANPAPSTAAPTSSSPPAHRHRRAAGSASPAACRWLVTTCSATRRRRLSRRHPGASTPSAHRQRSGHLDSHVRLGLETHVVDAAVAEPIYIGGPVPEAAARVHNVKSAWWSACRRSRSGWTIASSRDRSKPAMSTGPT